MAPRREHSALWAVKISNQSLINSARQCWQLTFPNPTGNGGEAGQRAPPTFGTFQWRVLLVSVREQEGG